MTAHFVNVYFCIFLDTFSIRTFSGYLSSWQFTQNWILHDEVDYSSHCFAPHMSHRWIPMFDRRSTGDRSSSSTADYDPHCGSGPLYGYRHACWEWTKVIGVWDFLSGFCESLRKALWCQMTSDQELVYMENPWYFVNSRRRIHIGIGIAWICCSLRTAYCHVHRGSEGSPWITLTKYTRETRETH